MNMQLFEGCFFNIFGKRSMKVSHPDHASVRENALGLHKSGDLAEAVRLYAILLKDDPTNADILGLMGMAQYRLGNRGAAKAAWLTSLSQQAASPIMLRNMNNFFTALLQEGTAAEFPLVSEFPIPDWPAGLDPSKSEKDMIISLARGLLHVGRKSDATKLLESVVPRLVDDAVVIGSAAEIMLAAGHADRADLLLQPLTAAAGRAEAVLPVVQVQRDRRAGRELVAVLGPIEVLGRVAVGAEIQGRVAYRQHPHAAQVVQRDPAGVRVIAVLLRADIGRKQLVHARSPQAEPRGLLAVDIALAGAAPEPHRAVERAG